MSGRRKRKPEHTYKYVQQNEDADSKKEDADKVKEVPEEKDKTAAAAAEEEEEDNDEPPKKKQAGEEEVEGKVAAAKKDPYEFLSDGDRRMMQTDILEFLKRFAPKFYVPVYKTWTIPKSAVH